MKKILKYEIPAPLSSDGHVSVQLRRHSQILSVGAQGERLMLWAMVDTDEDVRSYDFLVLGTGWALMAGSLGQWSFLGTIHMEAYELVWHVFVKP